MAQTLSKRIWNESKNKGTRRRKKKGKMPLNQPNLSHEGCHLEC